MERGMDTWGCEKSESSSTRFAARPDDHETMALRAAVWAEAARRPANWRPRSPGEGPSRPVSEPLALRPGFAAAGSPPSPPATSTSAAIMSGRVQGHLTFGKSKDKAWAPRPSLRQPLAPQPSRRRPPEAPDILEVTEFTPHSPAKSRGPPGQARPAKSQRLDCTYSRRRRKKFRFFHPDKVLRIICKKSGKFQQSIFKRRPLGCPSFVNNPSFRYGRGRMLLRFPDPLLNDLGWKELEMEHPNPAARAMPLDLPTGSPGARPTPPRPTHHLPRTSTHCTQHSSESRICFP